MAGPPVDVTLALGCHDEEDTEVMGAVSDVELALKEGEPDGGGKGVPGAEVKLRLTLGKPEADGPVVPVGIDTLVAGPEVAVNEGFTGVVALTPGAVVPDDELGTGINV